MKYMYTTRHVHVHCNCVYKYMYKSVERLTTSSSLSAFHCSTVPVRCLAVCMVLFSWLVQIWVDIHVDVLYIHAHTHLQKMNWHSALYMRNAHHLCACMWIYNTCTCTCTRMNASSVDINTYMYVHVCTHTCTWTMCTCICTCTCRFMHVHCT